MEFGRFKNLVLKTKQCKLRLYRRSDVESCFKILQKYPEITRFTLFDTPQKIEETYENFESGGKYELNFAILVKGEFIGRCGLHKLDDKEKSMEFGFWISPAFQGRGIGTEVLREICRFAFEDLGLSKLESGAFAENIASIRVHEKVGFQVVGKGVKKFKKHDRPISHVDFELLKKDFHKLKK